MRADAGAFAWHRCVIGGRSSYVHLPQAIQCWLETNSLGMEECRRTMNRGDWVCDRLRQQGHVHYMTKTG